MRHVMRLMAVMIWCALAVFCVDTARAEKRLALSVGIDVYDNLPPHEQLRKAVNDARAMGAALRELGFDATVEENISRLAFTRAWQKFLNRLEPGDTAALFFAGHGVEIAGLNYLLPRDVPKVVPGEDRVLAEAAIRFNTLMDDLRDKRVRVALFVVDACRDNPFRDGSGRSVGGGRGLARVEPAEGSFVMYSAGAGEQALDRLPGADVSPNSVYTRTLLPILAQPGLTLQDIATRVREQVVEVARAAGRRQTPAYYDQLVGKFLLKAVVVAPKPAVVSPSEAERAWSVAKDTTSVPVLEAFIRRFGDTYYGDLAKMRLGELKQAEEAKKKAEQDIQAEAEAERQRLAMLKAEQARKRAEEAKQAADAAAKKRADDQARAQAEAERQRLALLQQRKDGKRADAARKVGEPTEADVEWMKWKLKWLYRRPSPLTPEEERALKPKTGFVECDECPRMVVVPAGEFMMGSPASEKGRYDNEGPQRKVTIAKPFAVGMDEVTFAEWDACVTAGGCKHKHEPGDQGKGRLSSVRPVVGVSWNEITNEYLPWLSHKAGKPYRLLTEAEWEYAARAEPTTDGWNAFGIYNMLSGASEWVEDCYLPYHDGMPTDGSAVSSATCKSRVIRGVVVPTPIRPARRIGVDPVDTYNRMLSHGFRVARSLDLTP